MKHLFSNNGPLAVQDCDPWKKGMKWGELLVRTAEQGKELQAGGSLADLRRNWSSGRLRQLEALGQRREPHAQGGTAQGLAKSNHQELWVEWFPDLTFFFPLLLPGFHPQPSFHNSLHTEPSPSHSCPQLHPYVGNFQNCILNMTTNMYIDNSSFLPYVTGNRSYWCYLLNPSVYLILLISITSDLVQGPISHGPHWAFPWGSYSFWDQRTKFLFTHIHILVSLRVLLVDWERHCI